MIIKQNIFILVAHAPCSARVPGWRRAGCIWVVIRARRALPGCCLPDSVLSVQKVADPGSGTAPPTRGHCSFFQCLPQNESDRLPRASVAAHSPWTPAAFCPFLRNQPSPGRQAAPRPVHRTRSFCFIRSEFLLDLQAIPETVGYRSAYLYVHYFFFFWRESEPCDFRAFILLQFCLRSPEGWRQ